MVRSVNPSDSHNINRCSRSRKKLVPQHAWRYNHRERRYKIQFDPSASHFNCDLSRRDEATIPFSFFLQARRLCKLSRRSAIQDRVSYVPASNLLPLCMILADLAGYNFDSWDWSAISTGLSDTDAEGGNRFTYEFKGTDLIQLSIARESATNLLHVHVHFPEHLIGRVETALDIASQFGLSTNRWLSPPTESQ